MEIIEFDLAIGEERCVERIGEHEVWAVGRVLKSHPEGRTAFEVRKTDGTLARIHQVGADLGPEQPGGRHSYFGLASQARTWCLAAFQHGEARVPGRPPVAAVVQR